MVALSWGTEAEMLGSLMTLASGRVTSAPSSARSSGVRWSSVSDSGKAASTRPASEMSRVSTSMPATRVKVRTTGSSDRVARAGASSVSVQMIVEGSSLMLLPFRIGEGGSG